MEFIFWIHIEVVLILERVGNMIKLYVEKIDDYDYYFSDDKGNKFILNIELYNTIEKIEISDIIYIDGSLLNINMPLSFELLVDNSNDIDFIINKKDKILYFKRIYG